MQRLEHRVIRVKERMVEGVRQRFPITVMAPEHFREAVQRQKPRSVQVRVERQEDFLVSPSASGGSWTGGTAHSFFRGYRVGTSYEARGAGRPVRYFDQAGYLPTDKRLPDPENHPFLQVMQEDALRQAVLGGQALGEQLPGAMITIIGPTGEISPQEGELLLTQRSSS